MYKNIFKILFCILIVFRGYSQCNGNMSTDPYNAQNNELPDINQQISNPLPPYVIDERYLNGFNWWLPNEYDLEPNMEFNPGQPYQFMSNIQHPSQQPYYNYLKKHLGYEELNIQNGWELLLVNIGRFPDNESVLGEQSLRAIPYIVLYNRYRGIVRVFVQYGRNEAPPNAVDGVKINLRYDDSPQGTTSNLSGLLRLGSGVDKTLDQPTETQYLTTIVPTNGQYNFWMSGDFQIAYDPLIMMKSYLTTR